MISAPSFVPLSTRRAAVPLRLGVAVGLLVAGIGTLVTSFASWPAPVVGVAAGVWATGVLLVARARSRAPLTAACVGIKAATVAMIVVVVFDPGTPVGPVDGLDWIPLGLLNAGSGLWFLAMIRGRAR